MKTIFFTIGITALKIFANLLYVILKIFPTKNRIIMITRQSNNPTIDLKLLKEYFKDNKEIEVKVFAKKIEDGIVSKIKYMLYILKTMYYLATSKVCVIDGYCIPVSILKHKKKLKIIQIWHASGAIKKFGYQILDKKEGRNSKIAELMCMHKNYNHVIAPSKTTLDFFAEAFNTPKEKFVKLGLPRLEYISNSKYDKSNDIYKEYPHLKEKENILYVPTFRKDGSINLTEEILQTKIDKDKYNLIIKLHPLDKTEVPKEYLIDRKYSSYDLIKIADYIITDYSAISIEASILEKPIFLLLNDLEDYQQNRGLNVNLNEELSTFVCSNFLEVMDKIYKKNYNINEIIRYRRKYIEIECTNCINEMGKFICNLMEINEGETK